MSDRELELLILAARLHMAWRDSNPDVGMGPSKITVLQQVAEQLSFPVSPEDLSTAFNAWVRYDMQAE